jgi:outer membrane protein, heavy metal efflux system
MGTSQWATQLSQTIELGGKRGRRIDSAEAASQVEAYSLEDLKRQTVLLVKQSYVGIIVAKAQAEQTRINLKELDDQLRLQSLRTRTGDLSDLDYLRVEQQRFQFESDAADADQNLLVAKVNFRAAVGVDQLPEQFDVTGTFDLREVKLDRQALYRLAEQNRPDVREAVEDVRRAQADNRLAHANAVPDITPSLGYGWTSDRPEQIFNNTTVFNGNILGVSFDIPLFSRNQGEIERTAKDAQRVGVVQDAVIVQAHAEVDIASAGLNNARVKYTVLRDNYFPKARTIRDRTQLAYRQGAASLLDFLDAEREFRSTAFAFISAKGSYDSAVYQLEAAVGGSVK